MKTIVSYGRNKLIFDHDISVDEAMKKLISINVMPNDFGIKVYEETNGDTKYIDFRKEVGIFVKPVIPWDGVELIIDSDMSIDDVKERLNVLINFLDDLKLELEKEGICL